MKPYQDFVIQNMQEPIFTESVKVLGGLLKKERIVVLSNLGLNLFAAKQVKLIGQYHWYQTKGYEITDTVFKLSFPDVVLNFENTPESKFPKQVALILQKLLTPAELSLINPKLRTIPTERSGISKVIQFYPERIKELTEFLRFTPGNVLINEENLNYIFELIPLLPEISSIDIEMKDIASIAPKLLKFIQTDSKINHINFIGQLPNTFSEIINAITSSTYSRLLALSFTESQLTETHFYQLLSIINIKQIKSLSFHNAFPSSIYYFYNKFVHSVRKPPRFLNLRYSSGISLQNLFTSRTVMLSLEDCNLEIPTIFEVLSTNQNNFKNLRVLNVSHNTCSKTFGKNTNLPPNIHTIFANGIHWKGFHMKTFFEILFSNFESGLELSFAQTDANQGEWTAVDDYLSLCTFRSLQVLDWSGNHISRSFISFLSRQKFLQTLIVNDCFTENRPAEVKLFASYLEGSPINRLVMNGTEATHLGELMSTIITSLKKTPNINEISLAKHYSKSSYYAALKEFVTTRTNKILFNFDYSYPSSFEDLEELLNFFLKSEDVNTVICFPFHDVFTFVGAKTEFRDVTALLDKFARKYSKNKEYETPWDRPYKLPWFAYKFEFPEYATDKQISATIVSKGVPRDQIQSAIKTATPMMRSGDPITTPIWSGTARPSDIEEGRRHRHRTPMTMDNETPKRNSPEPKTEKPRHHHHHRHAHTLQGEEDLKTQDNTFTIDVEREHRHRHRNPTPQPHTHRHHRSRNEETKEEITPLEITQKIEPLRSSKRRSQSTTRIRRSKSPLRIETTNNLSIDKLQRTEIKAVSLLKLNNSPTLEISKPNDLEKPMIEKKRRHRHAMTLTGDDYKEPTEEIIEPTKSRHRHKKSAPQTIDEDSPKFELDEEPQSIQPKRHRKKKDNFILKDETPEKRHDSSEEEPLFVNPIYLQSDQKKSPAQEEKPKRIRKHRKQPDDAKWNMPTLPAYPVNDNIWVELAGRFKFDDMVAEIKSTPIDLHYHHMPDEMTRDLSD